MDGEAAELTLDLERVRSRLTFPDDQADSLARVAQIRPVPGAFSLPSADESRRLLGSLGVAPDAIEEAVEAMPSPESDAEAWWLLERLYDELLSRDEAGPLWWPYPEPAEDAMSRYFQLYVFLAALPQARELHVARGIDEDVTWDTLRDVAISIEWFRRRNGRPGFNSAFWMAQHFRGGLFQLGRLQFNFEKVDFDPGPEADFSKDDPCLGVHIPALGPLTPEACDASVEKARSFFPEHFPERSFRVATCGSWLLDPQLAEYLPEESNIVRFQQRFTPVPEVVGPGDDDVIRFVFGYVPQSLDELPQTTTLERAAVTHIRSGRHWSVRTGWFEL